MDGDGNEETLTNTLISDIQDFDLSENERTKVRMKNNPDAVDFVELHLNDKIINLIVDEWNRYATNSMIESAEQVNSFSPLQKSYKL